MDTSTLGLISATLLGAITVLTGWFKLFRASKSIESRLVHLEKEVTEFVTITQVVERIKSYEDRFGNLNVLLKSELDKVNAEVLTLDVGSRVFDRDITRIQEAVKAIEGIKCKLDDLSNLRAEFLEKFTRRGDFVREMQIMTSQLSLVQQKIDRIDVKLDEGLLTR